VELEAILVVIRLQEQLTTSSHIFQVNLKMLVKIATVYCCDGLKSNTLSTVISVCLCHLSPKREKTITLSYRVPDWALSHVFKQN
jgi:hypothetical protein